MDLFIKATMAVGKSQLHLCFGACLKCSKGTDSSNLLATGESLDTSGLPLAVVTDCEKDEHILPFGTCSECDDEPCDEHMDLEGQWNNIVDMLMSSNNQSALNLNSFLVCNKGGIITPLTTGQSETSQDLMNYYIMMEQCYGFSMYEASLILTAIERYPSDSKKNIYSLLAATSYPGEINLKDPVLLDICWKITAGHIRTEDAKRILMEKCGVSQNQADTFFNAINRQHNEEGTTRDFAHEMAIYSSYTYNDGLSLGNFGTDVVNYAMNKDRKGEYIDYVGDLKKSSSYKGDVDSGIMPDDDKNSDIDTSNLWDDLKNEKDGENIVKTITDYNLAVENGDINRADEFLLDLGNSSLEQGYEVLERELNEKNVLYEILSDNEEKTDATREEFLKYVKDNSSLENK